MKKGFTLIEMLGIIVILSLLVLITYSGITTVNRKAKEKEFEDYKKTLNMATETYIKAKGIDIDGTLYVEVNDLLNESFIDKVVENPKTKVKNYRAKIKVTKDSAGVLIFEYIGE